MPGMAGFIAGIIRMAFIPIIPICFIMNGEVMASPIVSRATAKEPFEAVLIASQTFINRITRLSDIPYRPLEGGQSVQHPLLPILYLAHTSGIG